jgi:hypothetical protein
MKFIRSIISTVLITAALIGMLELGAFASGLRAAGTPPFTMALFSVYDPMLGFRGRPDARWWVDMTPQGAYVQRYFGSTDSMGYRPMAFNANCAECPSYVVLGDSMTFGIESPDNATWPELLAQQLQLQGKKAKVRNISYRGWGTLQQALALEEFEKSGGNADVVLLMMIPNDINDNFDINHFTSTPVLEVKDGEIITHYPSGPGELAESDRVWRQEKWIRKSALATYIYRRGGAELVGEGAPLETFDLTDEGFKKELWTPPSLEGFTSLLADYSSNTEAARKKQKALEHALARLKGASDRLGARLVVTTAPPWALENGKNRASLQALMGLGDEPFTRFSKAWAQHLTDVKTLAEKLGASYLEASPALDELSYRQYAARPNDWHHSAEANAYIARHFASQLLKP